MAKAAIKQDGDEVSNRNAGDRLLREAAQLFIQHGYERTTMRSIATATEISLGSIAYHFRTKEDILYEVMRVIIESGEEKALRVVAELDTPQDKLMALIEVELDSFLHDTGAIVIREWRCLPPKRQLALLEHRQIYEDVWLSVLEQCYQEGVMRCKPEIARRVLHGAFAWSETWFSTSGELTIVELVAEVMKLITQLPPATQ